MTQTSAVRERDFLENLLSSLAAEGFSVFPRPSRHLLPPFMAGYIPDAIALKPGRKIAIEVKRDSSSPISRTSIGDQIKQHPEWELRVYYVPEKFPEDNLPSEPLPSIEKSAMEVDEIKRSGHLRAALIAGWATLEAAARALLPEQLARPQPSNKLIEALASDGALTPSEADSLRRVVHIRNAAAHGSLDTVVSEADVDVVSVAIRRIIELLDEEKSPS